MDQQQYTTLVDVLKQVPDPRKRKGRRHRWLTLLCLIAAALASAQRTPRAIARWVREHREELFAVLPPSSRACPAMRPSGVPWRCWMSPCLEQALSAFQPSPAPRRCPTLLHACT